MRGTLYTIIVASLIALATVPATASADFHPVCEPPAAAYANVEMHVDPDDDSSFIYRGGAYCPSTTITITELELVHVPDTGVPSQVANTTGDPCQSTTTKGCIVSDTAPAVGGTYEVHMTFDVDDPETDGVDYPGVERSGTWLYLGVGQPIPLCVSAGAVPVQVGAC